jgi:hypothetical protein
LVTQRRGASALGCLVSLFIVAVIAYVGVELGRIYWRYYQFQDDMRQEVRFGNQRTNEQILSHLKASADSLGLPDEAKDITISRANGALSVEAEYTEEFQLSVYKRDIPFHPHAEDSR